MCVSANTNFYVRMCLRKKETYGFTISYVLIQSWKINLVVFFLLFDAYFQLILKFVTHRLNNKKMNNKLLCDALPFLFFSSCLSGNFSMIFAFRKWTKLKKCDFQMFNNFRITKNCILSMIKSHFFYVV